MTSVPDPSAPFVDLKSGRLAAIWHEFLKSLVRGQDSIAASIPEVDNSKASNVQPWAEAAFIEYPAEKDYTFVALSIDGTITEVVAQSDTGTCTVTVLIDGTELGGDASAVTTTKTSTGHASNNTLTPGQDVVLRITSNSGAEGVAVTLRGTRNLE